MYLGHFGLKEMPFSITPDTEFFMNRAGYQDALNVLTVALRSGEGFIKITGEVGVGKTLLCRKLMNTLGADAVFAYIHNPYLKPDTLLYAIADELDIAYEESSNQNTILKSITKTLVRHHVNGRQVIVCLDEVQAMPIVTLEVIRLLTNIETEKKKLVQVVLFGQPELDSVLEHPSIRQLKQRITFSYVLLPLNRTALTKYIQHRLVIAGYEGPNFFSKKSVDLLYQASNGVPRLVNILCHKALIAVYGEGNMKVKPNHMHAAITDTMEAQQLNKNSFQVRFPTLSRWVLGSF
jgi:MSHA biogenesis protein MshM